MAIVKPKVFSWNDTLIPTEGVVSFNVYYNLGNTVDYSAPKVNVPVVAGQSAYSLNIPAQLPISKDGTYTIGVSAVDAAGNESDLAVITSPFDFTAPSAPTSLKVA